MVGVKRLLDEYNYPPEGQEEAIDTVLKQCEHWVDSQGFF
jgi:type I restriction enzyme R subunit